MRGDGRARQHAERDVAGGGVVTIPSSAAELDARVKQDLPRFRTIVEKANIRPD